MQRSDFRKTLLRLCTAAMMAAVVFVGNYLRIKIPVSLGGTTSFTLANIFCALSGLLLGPWWGGLAAGMGSALFDVMDPEYIVEAPITFCTKGMYGLVAGLVLFYVFRQQKEKPVSQVAATACAAVAYLAAYAVKIYFYNGAILGLSEPLQRWALVGSKMPASIFNGVIAVIFAPILGVTLRKALRRSGALEN